MWNSVENCLVLLLGQVVCEVEHCNPVELVIGREPGRIVDIERLLGGAVYELRALTFCFCFCFFVQRLVWFGLGSVQAFSSR